MLILLLWSCTNPAPSMASPIRNGSRSGAPPTGSTLMTSAPIFDRSQVDIGAATNFPKSRTRMFFNTSNMMGSCRARLRLPRCVGELQRFLEIEGWVPEFLGLDRDPCFDEPLREF